MNGPARIPHGSENASGPRLSAVDVSRGRKSTLKPATFPRPARWALNLTAAAVLLALVIWKVQPDELRRAFGDFEVWPAILAVVLNAPLLALMTVRGQIVLRGLGHPIDFLPLFPISTFGNVLGNLTPGALGDLLRTPFIRSRHNVPYAHGGAAVLYERAFSVFVLALGTGIATAWISLPLAGAVVVSASSAAIAIAAPYIGAELLALAGPRLAGGEEAQQTSALTRVRGALSVSLDSLVGLLRNTSTTAGLLVINAAVFSVMALQFWLVGLSLGFTLNGAEAWAIFGASLLAGIVTLLPLGLGTFDVALATLLGAVGHGAEAGAAAALLVRATVTLPQGVAAVASYLYLMGGPGRSHNSD